MSAGTYDLIMISIKGEIVQARPIDWDRQPVDILGNDDGGEPMVPTKYMTTCPHCAQLVYFSPDNLFVGPDPEYKSLKCSTCDASDHIIEPAIAPTAEPVAGNPGVDVQGSEQKPKAEVIPSYKGNPFQDPIESGSIVTDNFKL